MWQQSAYIGSVLDEAATGELAEAYSSVRNPDGTLDNVMSIHSVNPQAMTAHHSIYTVCLRGDSPLTRIERELVGVSVSVGNSCGY